MALLLLSAQAVGQAQQSGGGETIRYTPYDPDAPAATVGGSIRGSENDLSLTIVAPPGLAATMSARPVIYWHASNRIEVPIELVLIEEQGEQPLAEVRLDPPKDAGFQSFALPAGVSLEVNRVYQFSVAAIIDEDVRSNDVFASALLVRAPGPGVEPSGEPIARAKAFAAGGAWYDALAELELKAEQTPEVRRLWDQLLIQAGLEQLLN